MKIQTETISKISYVCEVCHREFSSDFEAEACEKDHEREKERTEWFKTHEPKFKVGDLVKDLGFGFPREIKSIKESLYKTTFLYTFKKDLAVIEEERLKLYMEKKAFKKLTKSIKEALEKANLKLESADFDYDDELHLTCTKLKTEE